MDTRLVWVTQSVEALYTLVEKDPAILHNIDAQRFIHTPLHEASIYGKIDLAMELMILMPSFVRKLNTRGLSPLHLAVQNHQSELALELVKFDPQLILLRGRRGVTTLHVVAEKGDVDLLGQFLDACPECILDVTVDGDSALHIAVSNGRYEELELLIGWIRRRTQGDAAFIEKKFANKQNREGNTALHVASLENKHQAVNMLLKCFSLNLNIQNKDGFTALDFLRTNGRFMDTDTERLIQKSGGKSKVALNLPKVKKQSEILRSPLTLWELFSTIIIIRYRKGISDGTRNALLVITALVITTTYQTALQPPSLGKRNLKIQKILFVVLWGSNTISFVLALSLTSILLPLGKEYLWFYLLIAVPLFVSYSLAIYDIIHPYIVALIESHRV